MIELFKNRQESCSVINNLKVELSTGQFKNFVRMSTEDFEQLLSLIGPKIVKKNTRFRDAVPVAQRLAKTQRFF